MRRWIIIGAGAVAVLGAGAFAVFWFSGGSGEPSSDVTAPPIAASSTSSTASGSTEATAGSTTTTAPTSSSLFEISKDLSVATFELDEELRGALNHVVGTTQEVAGQIQIDTAEAANSIVGTVVTNARTFDTGNGFRDRAIRGPVILNSASDEFELITFEPTSIEGLSGSVSVGQQLDFSVVGDLTIKGVTKQVTFDVTATLETDSRLVGSAQAQVLRSEFDIGIPSVPNVANVTDEVLIRLEFVALPA